MRTLTRARILRAPRPLHALLVVLLAAGFWACDQHRAAGPDAASLAAEGAPDGRFASVAQAAAAAAGSDEPLRWSSLTAEALWAHVASLDSTVLVGLKEAGRARGIERGRPLVPRPLWEPLGRGLEAHGVELLYVDDVHPLVRVRLSGAEQVRALRQSPFVEYVEPARFDATTFQMASSSGCGAGAVAEQGRGIAPGDVVPFTLARHRVDRAWPYATGRGSA